MDIDIHDVLSWRTVRKLMKTSMETFMKEYDLKMVDVILIGGMYHHQDIDILNELTKRLCVNKGQASRAMDYLMKRGYVSSEIDLADRRIIHFYLTEEGLALAQKMDAARKEISDKMVAGIDEDKLKIFFEVIHQINANVDALSKKGE